MTARRRPRLLPLLQPRVWPGASGDEVTRTRKTTTTTTVVRSYWLAVAAALVVVSQLHVAAVHGQSLGKCPKKESMREFDPKQVKYVRGTVGGRACRRLKPHVYERRLFDGAATNRRQALTQIL